MSRPNDSKYKPRGLRWSTAKPTTKRTLKKEIDVDKNYTFRLYFHTTPGVSPLHFYNNDGGEVQLSPRTDMTPKVHFMLA